MIKKDGPIESCQALELSPRRIKELQNFISMAHYVRQRRRGIWRTYQRTVPGPHHGRRGSDPGGARRGDDPQV